MRISEALASEKPLAVHFPSGAVLNVVYRPTSYTVADLSALEDEGRTDPTRLLRMVRDIVVSWDLTDDSGEVISLSPPPGSEKVVDVFGDTIKTTSVTPEEERRAKIAADPLAQKVAVSILARIIRAVNEDMSEGE